MRILADESCDFAFVRALRTAGYDVEAVCDEEPGASDNDIFHRARRDGRTLLTEDKDFGEIARVDAGTNGRIVLIRIPAAARKWLTRELPAFIRKLETNRGPFFAVIQPGRMRISVPSSWNN